ncbi:MAG: hypothetical protein ACRCZ9_09240 [Fusobacteriaceae bacterium]
MKANVRPWAIGIVCLAAVLPVAYGFLGDSKVHGNSAAATALRLTQLDTVAKDGLVNACYTVPEVVNGGLLKLNEKAASSCVRSTGIDGRVGFIAYKDGELRVQATFTQTEFQNAQSQLKATAKK